METTGWGFPFTIDGRGRVAAARGDEQLRAKVLQVLLTAPGERAQLPEFGCGLRELVFDPNNEILAAATEYTIGRALQHWLGDEIVVESVDVSGAEERLRVEVVYLRLDRLERDTVAVAF